MLICNSCPLRWSVIAPCSRDWSWRSRVSWELQWVLESEEPLFPHLELFQGLESGKHWVPQGQPIGLQGALSHRCPSLALSCPRTSFSPPKSPGPTHSTRPRRGPRSPNMQTSTRALQEVFSSLDLTWLLVCDLVLQQTVVGPSLSLGPS